MKRAILVLACPIGKEIGAFKPITLIDQEKREDGTELYQIDLSAFDISAVLYIKIVEEAQ